jgi:TonB family protein
MSRPRLQAPVVVARELSPSIDIADDEEGTSDFDGFDGVPGGVPVQGVVIFEATVGRDGRVEDVEVLRSVPLVDGAAIDAVRQWVYDPLRLNGQAERFILTVPVRVSLS